VLVLTVDLDEVVAKPLQEPDRHGRVVHEGAMTSRLRELSAHDELSVVQGKPGVVEHGRDRVVWLDVEHCLDGGGVGIGANDVGLGPGPSYQHDRVDEHGLASAGLAGEDVEPRPEHCGDCVDHGEVPDPNLPKHLGPMLGQRSGHLKRYPSEYVLNAPPT